MSKFSWVPGLPSLGPTYDMWAVDYGGERRRDGDHDLLFLVVDDGDEVELLANRTGETVRLDGRWLGRRDHEKTKVEFGSRSGLVKYWGVLNDDDDEIETREPPEAMLGTLPPRDPTPTQLKHRYEELGI